MDNDTTTWIIIAVVVLLLVLGALALMASRSKKRKSELRERFGPEYDRRVEESGSEREASKHLGQVKDRRDQLQIRPLESASRARYMQRWEVIQSDFVDRPGPAVDQADAVVTDVMRERGYPVDDFSTRADMIAADHPHVVEDYRAATDARERHHDNGSTASTEELRRAMVHYRSLFERLVSDGDHGRTEGHGRDEHHRDDDHRDDDQGRTDDQHIDLRSQETHDDGSQDRPGRHAR